VLGTGIAQALPSERELVRVADIREGSEGSGVNWLTPVGDQLFFVADDGEHGGELWVTDGTEAGTRMVADLRPGGLGSVPHDLVPFKGRVVFVGLVPQSGDFEVLSSDGEEITRLAPGVEPYLGPQPIGDKVAFLAQGGGLYASEDGVTASQLATSPASPAGSRNFAFNGRFIYQGSTQSDGMELWAWDGTASPPERFTNMPSSIVLEDVAFSQGRLFFAHDVDSVWVTDLTLPGTQVVWDPTNDQDYARRLTALGDRVFFEMGFGANHELWVTDGTPAGTQRVEQPAGTQVTSHCTARPIAYDGRVYFRRDTDLGAEPWFTDGTTEGTGMLKNVGLSTLSSDPANFAVAGGELFFTANDHVHGRELWRSDGTAEGTVLAGDINPGEPGSDPQRMADFRGSLFFAANDGESGEELWRTADVTPPDTRITKRPPRRIVLRGKRRKARVVLRFTADEEGATFRCKLDRGRYKKCSSPHKLRVKPGKHTVQVQAVDAAGNRDKTPAKVTFRVRKRR